MVTALRRVYHTVVQGSYRVNYIIIVLRMFIETATSGGNVRSRLRRCCRQVNVFVLDHLQEFHGLRRRHVFHVLVQLVN